MKTTAIERAVRVGASQVQVAVREGDLLPIAGAAACCCTCCCSSAKSR